MISKSFFRKRLLPEWIWTLPVPELLREDIADFEQGKTDILIGTQMVSKGLDFDHVSIVGILNADTMLNYPDFRSYERAFH